MLRQRGPIVVGAAMLALAVLLFMFLLVPERNKVADAEDQLTAAEARESTLESQLIALNQAKEEAPANKQTIQDVENRIPPTADEAGIIRQITGAASQAAVSVVTMTPGTPLLNEDTGLSEIVVVVSTKGTYFSQVEFLYNLETLPRAAKVTSTTIAASGEESVTTIPDLEMQTTVTLYTTDTSAGPNSVPGPTTGTGTTTTAPGTPAT